MQSVDGQVGELQSFDKQNYHEQDLMQFMEPPNQDLTLQNSVGMENDNLTLPNFVSSEDDMSTRQNCAGSEKKLSHDIEGTTTHDLHEAEDSRQSSKRKHHGRIGTRIGTTRRVEGWVDREITGARTRG